MRHPRFLISHEGILIEEAIRHHLPALQEFPADIINPRLIIWPKAAETLVDHLENARAYTGCGAFS
jgi:hypothetical protein